MKKIAPDLIQCIYGKTDDDDACQSQTGMGYELVGFDGDHHFDGDYAGVTKKIMQGLRTRLGN